MADGPTPPKPPESGAPKPPPEPKPEPPPEVGPRGPRGTAAKKIQRQLEDLLAGATIGLATVDPRRAQILNESAEDLARVWARLADENPAVRRYLEGMLSGSAWGEAILVTAVVGIRMLPESFEVPGGFFGGGDGGEPDADSVPPSPEVTLQQEADELQRRRVRAEREEKERSAAPQSAPKAEPHGDDGSNDGPRSAT